MAKTRYRTTIATPEPEYAGTGSFEPGDLFRVPVALFLLIFAGYGVWFAWLTTVGERLSSTGWKFAAGTADPILGQQMLAKGMGLTPWEPEMVNRYTGMLIRRENEKLSARRYTEMNAAELAMAYDLLGNLVNFHPVADQMVQRRGTIARMMEEGYTKAGQGNPTEAAKWTSRVLAAYRDVRTMKGAPQGLTSIAPFYADALRACSAAGRPDEGVLFWSDFRTDYPYLAFEESAPALRGIDAELRFGFDANAFLDLLTLRLEKPDNKDALRTWNDLQSVLASEAAIKIIERQMPK